MTVFRFLLLASLLAAPAAWPAEPLLKANPAHTDWRASQTLRAWYESRVAKGPTPDEKYFMAQTLKVCHTWLYDLSKMGRNWPSSIDTIPWPDGPRKRAALYEHARCKTLEGVTQSFLSEAQRLEREALAEGSLAASTTRILQLMRIDPHRAADQAIDVALASRDAYVYSTLSTYLSASESHARMREFPVFNPANYFLAWRVLTCEHIPGCGSGAAFQRAQCLHHGRCDDESIAEQVGKLPQADRREVERFKAFFADVIAKGQWDRLGIPARRYPGIENVNRLPSRFKDGAVSPR